LKARAGWMVEMDRERLSWSLGKTDDVAEFVSGLNHLGFEPQFLRIETGEHMQHPIQAPVAPGGTGGQGPGH